MKPLPNPPNHVQVLIDSSNDVLQEIFEVGLNEPNGKYLHWEKLKRWKPIPGRLSPEQFWCGVKYARLQSRKAVPLKQKNGQEFWFAEPDLMRSSLHQFDRQAAGTITSSGRSVGMEDKERYLIRSLIEEPFSSSVLEGAATTRDIARKLIDENRRPRSRDERMVLNNYLAMRFVREHVDEDLTSDLILEIHRIVSKGTLDDPDMEGVLRTSDRNINVVDDPTGEILHKPPAAEELESRLQNLCDYANGKDQEGVFIHPIVKAIILHFMIGYDHPFVDGNGRTARALFYWYAIKTGHWLLEYVSISKTIMEAPVKYGRAYLETESDGGDLAYFIIHQVNVLMKALEELHVYIDRRTKQLSDYSATLRDSRFNHRQAFLLNDAVRDRPARVGLEQYQRMHSVSYHTARNDLEALVGAGLYRKKKIGGKSVYLPKKNLMEKLAVMGAETLRQVGEG